MYSPPNPTRIVPGLAACLACLALSGCSTQDAVLARVGDRTVTVSQFRELAESVSSRYPVPPDTAKRMLLDDIIRRELMLVAAKGNPAVPDSFVARRRKEVEDDALSRALLDELTPHDVGTSDAEVRRLYLWRQQSTHCQIALTLDESSARMARHAIDRGEDFGTVAKRYDVTGTLPPAGDVGFVEAGALVNPLDRIVRETPVGAVVGPFESPGQGWFIVKILAREAREHGTFEQQEPQLRTMLEQRKQRTALLASYADLREQYGLTTDADGLELMFQRLNAASQLQNLGPDPTATVLRPKDRAVVVGRWDGGPGFRGTLTLGEAVDDLVAGRGGHITPMRFDTYADWTRNAMLARVAVIEARRRHLGEEPKTAEHIRQAVDDAALQIVYQTSVVARAEPNDAEVAEAYARNAPAFAHLKSVAVQYLALPESAEAVSAAGKAMAAGSLMRAGAAASPAWNVHEETVKFPTHDATWQILEQALAQQTLGGFLGPIRAPDGWRIVQILARDAPLPPFDQLAPQQQQGLRQQARQQASERQLRFFTDSLRAKVPVTVDRERLRRIPWPTPSLMQLMQGMQGS